MSHRRSDEHNQELVHEGRMRTLEALEDQLRSMSNTYAWREHVYARPTYKQRQELADLRKRMEAKMGQISRLRAALDLPDPYDDY